jgi:hypothetical protein
MDTLRLLGAATPIDAILLEEVFGSKAGISANNSAHQANSSYGGAVTFETAELLRKATTDKSKAQGLGIYWDTDFHGITILHSPADANIEWVASLPSVESEASDHITA